MENYYLVNFSTKTFYSDFIINNGSILTRKDGQIIVDESIIIKDVYDKISFFINFKYEFLIIENEHTILLVNKHNLNVSELGHFKDPIILVTNNIKYTLVVASNAIVLFSNEYFDILGEIENINKIQNVYFSTDDTFCVLFADYIVFYNIKMEILSKVEVICKCACYIEKYNYWCIVTKEKILFIEENGCVYNSIILNSTEDVSYCYSVDNKLILFTRCYVILLVLVDGHWRTKITFKFDGEFLSYYDGVINIKKNNTLYEYFINSEYCRIGNLFLVSDYKEVLVYDFDKKKMATYDFKLEFKKSIERILIDRNEIGILFDDCLFIFDNKFNLLEKEDIKIRYTNLGICLKDREILTTEVNLIGEVLKMSLNKENNKFINMHNIDGTILYITSTGEIYKESTYHTKIRLEKINKEYKKERINREYEIYYKEDIVYFLYNNILSYNNNIIEGITSFYILDDIIYTKEDKLFIYDSEIITDINFKILGCTELEIYGISRFNSIDTYYNKKYIKKQIEKYFREEDYARSIDMMIKHNIKINMQNINVEKMTKLNHKNVLFVLDDVIKNNKLIFNDEFVYILNNKKLENLVISRDLLPNRKYSITIENKDRLNKIEEYISNNIVLNSSTCKLFIEDFLIYFKNDSSLFDYFFIKCGRIDLSILYTKNLESCIKTCRNLVSVEEIKKSIILCFGITKDVSFITKVCRFINEDVYFIKDLETNYCKLLEIYKLFDELIFNLVFYELYDDLLQIVTKYNLYDKLLIYVMIFKDTYLLNLYVQGIDVSNKIWIYQYLKDFSSLLEVYVENQMYKEIFLFTQLDTEIYKNKVINRLVKRKKYKDLGFIYEIYLKDYNVSLDYFLKGGCIRDIYRLFINKTNKIDKLDNNDNIYNNKIDILNKDKLDNNNIYKIDNTNNNNINNNNIYKLDKFKVDLINIILNQFTLLEKIEKKLKKYIKRLQNIQHDIEDDSFSVTSVCKTNRGIPGNLYEYEFYLEKVNELLLQIINWVEETKMIQEMSYNKELDDLLKRVKSDLEDVPLLFNVSYERSKELITCIDLSKILQ